MSNPNEKLSTEEMNKRGEEMARVFRLKKVKGYDPPRFETTHGNKTGQGIFLTAKGAIDGENDFLI